MIEKLPALLVSRIASGQIAVSPSSVIKELVENSLDAESSKVMVFIDDQFNFRVVDNGRGIRLEEIPISIERFTTDKIKKLEDFESLRTYGFRGEALNAIASVSRLTLKSQHYEEDVGGKLTVEAGEVKEFKVVASTQGTSVAVCDLFFNVPVRRKSFTRREIRNMVSLIIDYAVANPDVSFFVEDYRFPPSSLEERVSFLFGGEMLRRIETENSVIFLNFKNERFVGRKLRKIFINRRPVLYEKIDKLLLSLDVDNYILFFDVPPSSVDFNVTPLKDRVLLRNEEKFLSEIRSAVERKNFYLFQPPKTVYVKEETFSERLKVIGHNETIVLAEDRDYFYFLDIHLVHERVNYEMLLEQLRSGEVKSTKLLNPVIFDGDEKVLSKFGIKWSKVNGKVLIKEIPAILNLSDIERLSRGESPENVASVACRRAIKSGEELKEEDLNKLLDLYLRCKEKRFCPHGRPIYYRISKREVYRNLGRLL